VLDGFKKELASFNETGLTDDFYDPDYQPKESYIGYDYGASTKIPTNYSFLFFNTTWGDMLGNIQPPSYMMDVEAAMAASNLTSTWAPIPQMQRDDADVTIWFIMHGGIAFVEPNNDPIFSANIQMPKKVITPAGGIESINYYIPAEPLTVMSCATQYQWCQPRSSNVCTPWSASGTANISSLGFNDRQLNITQYVARAMSGNRLSSITISLGNAGLLASGATGYGQAGSRLYDDQWIRELDHWSSIYWSSVQLTLSRSAVGSGVAARDQYLTPLPEAMQWLCNSQVVQRSDYSSFNLLGVVMILCFGTLFLVVNLTLDPAYRFIMSRSSKGHWVSIWRRHYVLQLLTAAFEAMGMGQWLHDDRIPTTFDPDAFTFPLGGGYKDAAPAITPAEEVASLHDLKTPHHAEVSLPSPIPSSPENEPLKVEDDLSDPEGSISSGRISAMSNDQISSSHSRPSSLEHHRYHAI
jgi:hypothetical protein